MASIDNIEVTREMMEALAIAYLYREDASNAIRIAYPNKLTAMELKMLENKIKKHPDFKAVQEDVKQLESLSLTEDNLDTIMLQYNKILQKALYEKKYEVAARILAEIRKIKAIENEQMKFEVVIKLEKDND
jgi:hypothetical protein